MQPISPLSGARPGRAAGRIRTRIIGVHQKAGFIRTCFSPGRNRPDEFRAFFAYHDALLEKAGGLTKPSAR